MLNNSRPTSYNNQFEKPCLARFKIFFHQLLMWNKWTCKWKLFLTRAFWKPYNRVSVLLNDYSWSFRAYQIMNNFGYRYLVRGRVSCIDMMAIKIILLLMLLIKIEIANLVLTDITLCIYWSCWDGLIWVDLNMIVGLRICLIVTRFFLMKNTLNGNFGYSNVGDNVMFLTQC